MPGKSDQTPIDFETGKQSDVARSVRPNRNREYRLLAVVLFISCLPYMVAFWLRPVAAVIVLFFLAYFQVIIAFATSTATDTAHAIRFLLAGSNPIGMTGSSSLLFGAVDTIIDWKEDVGERRRNPLKFWALSVYKILMTPVGCVLMLIEYAWDIVLLQRPTLVRWKWSELFSLAEYHDIICPEKSNDIFYADMAFARWKDDVHLYQWNRLRSMVFELEHYRIDAVNSVGVAESNLFLQSEIAAFQTLKRLELEQLEAAVAKHYEQNKSWFPFPPRIADRLINNARPVPHYLRMRQSLLATRSYRSAFDRALSDLLNEDSDEKYRSWYVLRILDQWQTCETEKAHFEETEYVSDEVLADLATQGVVQQEVKGSFDISREFIEKFERLLSDYYDVSQADEIQSRRDSLVPDYFEFNGHRYLARES